MQGCKDCRTNLVSRHLVPSGCGCRQDIFGVYLSCNGPIVCPENMYRTPGGAEGCARCPGGTSFAAQGATSVSQCEETSCSGDTWKDIAGTCQPCLCSGVGEKGFGCPGNCPTQRLQQQPGRCFNAPCFYTPGPAVLSCPSYASEPCFFSRTTSESTTEESSTSTTFSVAVGAEVTASVRRGLCRQLGMSCEAGATADVGVERTNTRTATHTDTETNTAFMALRPGSQFCERLVRVDVTSSGHISCGTPVSTNFEMTDDVTAHCGVGRDPSLPDIDWCPEEIGAMCFGATEDEEDCPDASHAVFHAQIFCVVLVSMIGFLLQ